MLLLEHCHFSIGCFNTVINYVKKKKFQGQDWQSKSPLHPAQEHLGIQRADPDYQDQTVQREVSTAVWS